MLAREETVLLEEEVAHWRNLLKLSENPTTKEFAASAYNAGNAVMYSMWLNVKSNVYILTE